MNRIATAAAAGFLGAALLAATSCGADTEPQGSGAPKKGDVDPSVQGATLRTSEGDIKVTLFPERAPATVANFVGLAEGGTAVNPETGKEKFYDGTVFHRVIAGFMIQGGDPLGTGAGGPGYTFGDEIDPDLAFDEPGRLAMANSGPGTNGSQFFLTTAPAPHLNGKHTIFGEVADADGRQVLDAISQVRTDAEDRPEEDIVLDSVVIHRSGD